MIKPITSDQKWKKEEPETDYSFRTRAEKKSKSLIIVIGIIAAVLVVLALLFFLPKQEDKPEVITTEHPQEQEPVVSDPVPSVEQPVQSVNPPVQKKELPVQKEVQPVKRADRTTDVIIERPQRSSKMLDLGYATWEGKNINGKPDGYGIMTFHKAHRIDSRDDQGRVAQSGDKVKGNFINGHLEYGTWIKASGGQEEIFIGQ